MTDHLKEQDTLWGGRFTSATDPIMEKFNASIHCDKKMWRQDIAGSIEYSKTLQRIGILSSDEQISIQNGLIEVEDEWKQGTFKIKCTDEDIHTAVERRLKEIAGPVGGKLHTGRSRNDQVAVDLRLWLKDHLHLLMENLKTLIEALVHRAESEPHIIMPGYTHLQRAQAIRWPHWLLSHAWSLCSDLQRLRFVYWSTDVCPLGSGALAGNPFCIDREEMARNLKFGRVSQNSLHAVADRDFVAEYLFWCSLTACHLSRMAEDLIIFSSSEFGFVRLSDAFSTGSSLMPQKKNPDSLELIRGKTGRMIGNTTGFLAILKGLPTAYNKDLQEDKEMLFESANMLEDMIKIASGAISTMQINKDACLRALTEDMLATDLAYFLVRKGLPFREAHEKTGEVVARSEQMKIPISKVPLQELQKISPLFSEEVSAIWSFESSIEQYSALGGTATCSIKKQIINMKLLLSNFTLKL